MKRIYSLIISVTLGIALMSGAVAQSVNFGGVTFNNDIIGWGDLYNLSFTSHNYGTARSMAMGNAFTALGADLASASLNPAGIGMYTRSDVSISPILQLSSGKSFGADSFNSNEFKDKSSRFGLTNLGGVFAAYRGDGALTNFNIGFVYNRIADYNANYKFAIYGNPATNSLANVFRFLSDVDGLTTDDNGRMSFGNDPYYWGAVLAYKNGLTNKDAMGWFVDRIGLDANIDQFAAVETKGSLGEYAITMGFNFVDKFYLGATIGIHSLNYRRSVFYGEDYVYMTDDGLSGVDDMPYQLEYMNYMQSTHISGAGVNLKLGFTARPVKWLRVGVALHTPTAYNLSLRYSSSMWSKTHSKGTNPDDYDLDAQGNMYDDVESPVWEDSGSYAWRTSSPLRVMLGAAVTISKYVILSADYEAAFYQNTRLRGAPIVDLSYKQTMKDYFKNSNTLRVGGEFRVLPFMSLRAGYIWSGNALRNDKLIYTHPLITSQSHVTAGLGFRFTKSVYLDIAYQHNTTNYTSYQMFFATDEYNPDMNIESVPVSTKTHKHIAVATLGFRF